MYWLLIILFSNLAFSSNIDLGYHNKYIGDVHKPVLSIMDKRYVGIVRQNTDFSCGAAAVATILRHAYQQQTDEHRVMSGMLAIANPVIVERYGFSMLDMKQYVQMLGMRARGYQLNDTELRQVRVPTIALLNLRGYQHFVVLKAIDSENRVYIADPVLGNRIIDFNEFKKSWNGILLAIIGEGYRKNNILANPAPPLSLQRSGNLFAPITETQLLEFGFRHKDLL